MKRILKLTALFAVLAMASCTDTLDGFQSSSQQAELNVTLTVDGDANVDDFIDGRFTLRNVSTGRVSKYSTLDGVAVAPGLYDLSYEASLKLESGAISTVRAQKQSVILEQGINDIVLEAYFNIVVDDLIISEVFFTGTLQQSGNQYNGDNYFKLYNNTDHTIYADGLTLFESKFLTTEKRYYTPDIMSEAVAVQALYTIPGNGTQYPVEPGCEMLICDIAIDHRTLNPNSFDLSHADFEWYDESSVASTTDIDNPAVENLDKWYCYTKSIWTLHNRGFKAYGIARIPVLRDNYLVDNIYKFDYEIVTAVGTFPMSGDAYFIPNEWVVDVVTCSVESEYAWQVTAPALDCGWSYCGKIDKDKSRYFRSVRRKYLRTESDGRIILKDTNNSTDDFNPEAIPSEIERQHSAIDSNGTPATSITVDGVVAL